MSSVVTPLAADPAPATDASWRAPLTYDYHRGAYEAWAKATGVTRIAIVGDSLVYGQAVSYPETIAPRVATHLNTACPGLVVESLALGVPGGCFFHACARATTQARLLQPDIVIVAVCGNDANMLRDQPADLQAIGDTWVQFRGTFAHTLGACAHDVRAAGARFALVYFDLLSDYGSVRPAALLSDMCHAAGVPFIDVATAFEGQPSASLRAAPTDGHPSALAHDIAARHLARHLLHWDWLPPAAGYDDPAWIRQVADSARALVASGVEPIGAATRTLALIDAKWADRRNRARTTALPAYTAARDALERERAAALVTLGRDLARHMPPAQALSACEGMDSALHVTGALLYALEEAASTGRLGQQTADLGRYVPANLPPPAPDWAAGAQLALHRARGRTRLFEAQQAAAGGAAPHLSALAAMNDVLAVTAEWLFALAGRLPLDDLDVDRVLAAALRTIGAADRAFTDVIGTCDWTSLTAALEAYPPASPWVRCELPIRVQPGSETLALQVGVRATVPAWFDAGLYAIDLERSGEVTRYAFDLPLFLLGELTVTITVCEGREAGDLLDVVAIARPTFTFARQPPCVTRAPATMARPDPRVLSLTWTGITPFERAS